MAQVSTQTFLHACLQGAIANILNPSTGTKASIHLVSAPFTPTPTSTPASFTEATFPGYAALTVTLFGTQHPDSGNQWLAQWATPPISFSPSGTVTPNQSIYGYWIQDTNGELTVAEVFAAPVVMRDATSLLEFAVAIGVGPLKTSAVILP